MINEQSATQPALRVYQVNHDRRGPPLLVAATTSHQAVTIAEEYRADVEGRDGVLTADVTEEFEKLSDMARDHMTLLLDQGQAGIVEYDDEEGWLLREVDRHR